MVCVTVVNVSVLPTTAQYLQVVLLTADVTSTHHVLMTALIQTRWRCVVCVIVTLVFVSLVGVVLIVCVTSDHVQVMATATHHMAIVIVAHVIVLLAGLDRHVSV